MKVTALAMLLFATNALGAPAAPLVFKIGKDGNVAKTEIYSETRGYGFEPNDAAKFSVKLVEGNYRVTTRFDNKAIGTRITVKAEARRLMVDAVATQSHDLTRSFVVNIRTPALAEPPANAPGGNAVRLKPRELGSPTWDDRLTLEFLGSGAEIAALSVEPINVPTVYLAGDSTVTDQVAEPAASWGQMLPRFFRPDIAIANHAESGETLKSFLAELRLEKILSTLRAGDWLLIQFGHNDMKSQWPQIYADAATTYRDYLRVYITEARSHGATPILVTSPERRNWDAAGKIAASLGAYPDAVRAVARELHVALIDLNAMSKQFYEALGETRAALAFNDQGRDRTHHNNYGAFELARMVVEGVRRADPLLAAHLADDIGRFDPGSPDAPEKFGLPASSVTQAGRPDGN